jgi:riboflavin kinase/FMN adenylyltransferase
LRESVFRGAGAEVIAAGEDFVFGRGRQGDLDLLERLGFDVRRVPLVDGVSSTAIRALIAEGDVVGAAALLGRPAEVEGRVALGDQRGGTLGFPTANVAVPPTLLAPKRGIYARPPRGRRRPYGKCHRGSVDGDRGADHRDRCRTGPT